MRGITDAHVEYHLNGVPAYRIEKHNCYIGLAHHVLFYRRLGSAVSADEEDEYHKLYLHFFYKLSLHPPYDILQVSRPLRLHTSHSIAVWFRPDEVVAVSFVNGFDYSPVKEGREFLISYGVGDSSAKVFRISISQIMNLFD